MNVQKNDQVLVVTGKNRGKRGRVLSVDPKKRRVVVENVNVVKRHVKPSATLRQAGIVEQPAPVAVSNLKVICDKCGNPARVGNKVLRIQEGTQTRTEKIRICKSCQEQIG